MFGPKNLVRDGREASDLVPHGGLVLFRCLVVEKLVSEDLNVFFNLPEELNLVLLDGSLNFWSCEQGIEDVEDSEHLVGVLGLGKLGLEDSGDLRFNVVDLLIVGSLGAVPVLVTLLAHVKYIESVEELVSVVDFS